MLETVLLVYLVSSLIATITLICVEGNLKPSTIFASAILGIWPLVNIAIFMYIIKLLTIKVTINGKK